MPSLPLTVQMVFEHGRRVYSDRQVTHYSRSGVRSATFGEIGDQAERLASGLRRLGVREGDRVATYMWNNPEHLALYFAVPCMGAVLHTVNIRLDERQTAYV
ncbi:MAG TPA: AMP-binding protein, partial [Solirubrobacteraceae bacterium]|nr:AMP-binding protein [Solirubrobacteraceae bacterium]